MLGPFCAVGYQLNPSRGLTAIEFGDSSLRTPNVERSAGFSSGRPVNALASTRAPPARMRWVVDQLPPNAAAPIHSPPERSGVLSVLVNAAGVLPATSASEL